MKKNSSYTIFGDFECGQYNYNQFTFLTQGDKQLEQLCALILDEKNGSLVLALYELRRYLVDNGIRGNVAYADLLAAQSREELYNLINELCMHKVDDIMLDRLLDGYTLEQIYNYRRTNGLGNPSRLLTFSKEYAIGRFCLS